MLCILLSRIVATISVEGVLRCQQSSQRREETYQMILSEMNEIVEGGLYALRIGVYRRRDGKQVVQSIKDAEGMMRV